MGDANQTNNSSSDELIEFISKFTRLLEKQLVEIRTVLGQTVENVIGGIGKISDITESEKKTADKLMEDTYVNPDMETKQLVNGVQEVVSNIFDKATSKVEKGEDLSDVTDKNISKKDKEFLERNLELFSRKFKVNIDRLDNNIKEILFELVGALSSDDVIAQRMEHVAIGLYALQSAINYILVDYDKHSSADEIHKMTKQLKEYVFSKYTMEEEKGEFYYIFPEDKQKKSG